MRITQYSSRLMDLTFASGATEVMRVNGGGVGIGTTCPDAKLHVVGRMVLNDSENNVAIGTDTIGGFTTATRSVVIGDNAGSNLSSGDYNILIGAYAGAALTTQGNSTMIGTFAGQNSTSPNSVYLGYNARYYLTADKNVFIGRSAGSSNVTTHTAENSVGIGYDALKTIQDGSFNVALGSETMSSATSAASNVAIGEAAMNTTTTANFNVAVGRKALFAHTTGTQNTAIGAYSLTTQTIGEYNTTCRVISHFISYICHAPVSGLADKAISTFLTNNYTLIKVCHILG